MLFVNADDLGRNEAASKRIFSCFSAGVLSSASFMVFMADSESAAARVRSSGIEVGLHLNFTEPFSGRAVPSEVKADHLRVSKFLKSSKLALVFYNPFLRKAFGRLINAQLLEYHRLFGHAPERVDGHQHMHLCSNVLLDKLIPAGTRVRRSFSFNPGEKSFANRLYRRWVDSRLVSRHRVVDFFFALSQHLDSNKLRRVTDKASRADVELMTHPELDGEFEFLRSCGLEAFLQSHPQLRWR